MTRWTSWPNWSGVARFCFLDNCEHVIGAAAQYRRQCAESLPRRRRVGHQPVPLALQAEELWRLEPLPTRAESVQLFVDRARTRVSHFALSVGEEEVVADICGHLDGMPLAIELAAARVSVLSPFEIRSELERRFGLLRTSDPTAAPRQRSMTALLDWGQALLTRDQQAVFRRLSIFRTSFDLEAAAASAGFDAVDPSVADIVWSLADQSLLVVDRTEGNTRYRMLETMRAYAADRLHEAKEGAAARRRLAELFLKRFSWQGVTSKTGLGALALEVDTLAPLIDGLLDDKLGDEPWQRLRPVSCRSSTRLRAILRLLSTTSSGPSSRPPSVGMLARARVGAVLISVRLGQIDRAEEHLRQARRSVEDRGADDRWGRVSLGRAEADIELRTGATEAMALAADHLKHELDEPLSVPRIGPMSSPRWARCWVISVTLGPSMR